MEISEYKLNLRHGDFKRIAKLTGYSQNYVSMVFCGRRNPNRKILAIANRIISLRQKEEQALNQQIEEITK